jgi:hypothetical protein
LAKQLGMIDPAEFDTKGLPLTARAVCFISVIFKTKETHFLQYLGVLHWTR